MIIGSIKATFVSREQFLEKIVEGEIKSVKFSKITGFLSRTLSYNYYGYSLEFESHEERDKFHNELKNRRILVGRARSGLDDYGESF